MNERQAFGVVLSLLLGWSVSASARDAPRTYEGTVGDAGVVMAIDRKGADVDGQYFYRSVRFDIDLSGERKNGTLTLESRDSSDRMAPHSDGPGLSGDLTTAKGRMRPVGLHPVTVPDKRPADLPDGRNLYHRLQLAGLRFVPDREATVNGKKIRWLRESVTGIRLFRLEDGISDAFRRSG
jgi:hypothetical protein